MSISTNWPPSSPLTSTKKSPAISSKFTLQKYAPLPNVCTERITVIFSIKVKKSHNLSEILRLLTSFHEQFAIVKRKANYLLYM